MTLQRSSGRAGQHKPGYRRPRTGEPRKTRQSLAIDRMEQKVRDEILALRAQGKTWEEIESASVKFAGQRLPHTSLHRWYDLRVEQVQREVLAQAERARQLAAAFAQRGFSELPEATVNALSSEVFGLMESASIQDREKALGNLLFLLTKLMTARAKEKYVEIESRKLDLARRKFEELKQNADRATNEAAAKLGKGKALTLADINRIRERVLGLDPIAASHPA